MDQFVIEKDYLLKCLAMSLLGLGIDSDCPDSISIHKLSIRFDSRFFDYIQ